MELIDKKPLVESTGIFRICIHYNTDPDPGPYHVPQCFGSIPVFIESGSSQKSQSGSGSKQFLTTVGNFF